MDDSSFDFHLINIHKLEEEWPMQTRMYRHYADKVAAARYSHDTAKTDKELAEAEMERIVAKLDRLIRSAPEEFDLVGRPTEGAIKNTILLQQKYHTAQLAVFEAQRKINDAKHELDVAEVAVKTLEHRKAALEDLVRLRLASYYSAPRAPEGADRALQSAAMDSAFRRKSG